MQAERLPGYANARQIPASVVSRHCLRAVFFSARGQHHPVRATELPGPQLAPGQYPQLPPEISGKISSGRPVN